MTDSDVPDLDASPAMIEAGSRADRIEAGAERLYEIMERLEPEDIPGPNWKVLTDSEKDWYRNVAEQWLCYILVIRPTTI